MIKQIYIDGKPKDIETKIATDKFLKELEMHELEFIVGIDYAHKNSKDYTAISQFIDNEDKSLMYMGTKLL